MMDRRVVVVLLAAMALGACHKKTPPAAPVPQADTAGMGRAREDSLRAEEARRRAAEEAARAAAAAEALARAKAMLAAPIYFEYDASSLSDEAKQTLDQKVQMLRANADVQLRIEGNADERGSEEYNLALGMRRAEAARQYITGFGVQNNRLSTITNGEDKPADPGHDEAAWSKNRRDDFVITAGGERLTAPAASAGQ